MKKVRTTESHTTLDVRWIVGLMDSGIKSTNTNLISTVFNDFLLTCVARNLYYHITNTNIN